MPTTLPRTQVTITEPLERALQIGAKRWPAAAKSALITKLAIVGADAITGTDQAEITPFPVRSSQKITSDMVSDALANLA